MQLSDFLAFWLIDSSRMEFHVGIPLDVSSATNVEIIFSEFFLSKKRLIEISIGVA